MPGSFSTVIAHMEPPSSRKQAKRVRLGPERPLLGPWRPSEGPGEADLIPTTPDWPAWVGFMVTTYFDLVSGPFHGPFFVGIFLHSVSTSANVYHLNTCAGELPRSGSCHFKYLCILLLAKGAGLRNQTLEEITVEWSATLYNGPHSFPSSLKRVLSTKYIE